MRTLRAVRSFPLPVRLLLVNQLGVNTGFYLLIPYLAGHLGQDLGLSAVAVGVVLGVRNLSQQGLFVLGGSAADRLGPRGVIIAGCGLRTAGFALFALGDGIPVLLAASVLSGLAGALFNPAVRTYLAQESGERRAEAFALFNVFATAGALLGPVLGTLLLLADFRLAALTAAGIFALLTAAQAVALPARPVPAPTTRVLGDWREVLADRRFLAFALAMVGLYALETQLYLLLPAAARRATGLDGSVSLLLLTGTAANLALQLRITRLLEPRGDRARWIACGLAVMGLAFVPPLLLPGPAPLLLAVLLLNLGVMTAQPFVLELIPAFGRERLTGTYFGLFYLISGLAAAAGNAAVGAAMDASD
ncbi:MFS transporter, partial [Kitasatospora indigofera]